MRVHLDLELGGRLNLSEVGADVWSRHPDTVPILAGFAVDDAPAESFDFLHGPISPQVKFLDAIRAGAEVHAWNASFEATVWRNLLVPRFGYPEIPIERFHCTMVAAACAGLPMGLDEAGPASGAVYVKDKAGQALMKRMMRPRAINPDGTLRWWHNEDPGKLARLALYNRADVESERDIWRRIPEMTQRERAIWLTDQRMNARGIPVDSILVSALDAITRQELHRLNQEIGQLTEGVVTSASQATRLLGWLQARGYPYETLRGSALGHFIGSANFYALPQTVRKVLELRAEAAKTSTAKLRSIASYAQADGNARQLVQYGGAIRTLRWAGRGPQIQNFPRPIIKHVDRAIVEILDGMDVDGVREVFGKPLDVVSSCLRGVFKAPRGFRFVVADFHAIEAVVIAWLAKFKDLLDVFRRGEDIYLYTAASIGSALRLLGKVLRLACGFGMGPLKFQATAAGYGLDLSMLEAEDAVHAWRIANQPIVSMWSAYENAARTVIANPSMPTQRVNGLVGFRMALPTGRLAGSLLIEKPSGGMLVYRNARLEDNRITFDGVDQYTRQWKAISTYGGKLAENVTQSVARDLLADAMLTFDQAWPDTLVMTVHDEIGALVPEAHAEVTLNTMKTIMGTPPLWARGMPLSAAGYVARRYAKA